MTWPALIIFDLDGTLIDSAPDIQHAVNGMLREQERTPLTLHELTMMIGDGTHKLVERALAARPGHPVSLEAAHARFIELYEADPVQMTTPCPGVPAALARLAADGIRLAVCTNKPVQASRHILKALSLDGYFEHVVGGDSTPWRKPDPRVLNALFKTGASAEDSLMIGDSEVDAALAAAVPLSFVLMSYGYHRGPVSNIPHQALLNSMNELNATLLRQLAPTLEVPAAATP